MTDYRRFNVQTVMSEYQYHQFAGDPDSTILERGARNLELAAHRAGYVLKTDPVMEKWTVEDALDDAHADTPMKLIVFDVVAYAVKA
jgi:hypothetical protein